MAVVIEDGTVVANANSFVTVAEYLAWAEARGYTLPSEDATEKNIYKAMDYFVTFEPDFEGERLDDTQELPFPRTGQYINGVLIADGTIPKQVKELQYGIMKAIADGIDLFPTTEERALKRKKTGPLESEWFDSDISPTVTFVDALLAPLTGRNGFGLTVVRI